ncbi:MAG: helix-turn-helix domain-containing protein [Bacteroidota bacterium]
MEIICIEDDAFFTLLDKAAERIKDAFQIKQDKWLSGDKAMKRLHIKSRSTLQKLRDEGSIRFSRPEKKWIVYDADSIDEYLKKHTKEPF